LDYILLKKIGLYNNFEWSNGKWKKNFALCHKKPNWGHARTHNGRIQNFG
jgi:hypothetical protein